MIPRAHVVPALGVPPEVVARANALDARLGELLTPEARAMLDKAVIAAQTNLLLYGRTDRTE